jgi:hypothetical protein
MGDAHDSTASRYGYAHYPTEVLFKNISEIKFDVDLSHLHVRDGERATE